MTNRHMTVHVRTHTIDHAFARRRTATPPILPSSHTAEYRLETQESSQIAFAQPTAAMHPERSVFDRRPTDTKFPNHTHNRLEDADKGPKLASSLMKNRYPRSAMSKKAVAEQNMRSLNAWYYSRGSEATLNHTHAVAEASASTHHMSQHSDASMRHYLEGDDDTSVSDYYNPSYDSDVDGYYSDYRHDPDNDHGSDNDYESDNGCPYENGSDPDYGNDPDNGCSSDNGYGSDNAYDPHNGYDPDIGYGSYNGYSFEGSDTKNDFLTSADGSEAVLLQEVSAGTQRHSTEPQPDEKICVSRCKGNGSHDIVTLICGDNYCVGCLVALFIESLLRPALFPPRCHNHWIPLELVEVYLSDELISKYDAAVNDFYTTKEGGTLCSNPKCRFWVPPYRFVSVAGIPQAVCDRCQTLTCGNCEGLYHGRSSCQI
ncbi:unnamed protein product [Periconia digitata]|uniref:IBR domain-containing protein n=1 Tax=Periconia digitata TaxID=1303443 RepID=A0A9W4URW3_9PLEO|nr:unnamed protein product [Periconia digitata]